MVNLPVLRSIDIDDFGLYPGLSDHRIDLTNRLTLVLGANGIGKTSFVSLAFRMLTGPFDVPAARGAALGRGNLDERELDRAGRRYFANRVNDAARNSTAVVEFSLGAGGVFTIERNLSDLSLIAASSKIGRTKSAFAEEEPLKAALAAAAEVGSFSDWILLLRYIVFYQEDRQALIWDEVAQTQILRPLFLSIDDSRDWVTQEREIFALDSRRRNLSASLYQTDQFVRREQIKQASVSTLTKEVSSVSATIGSLEAELESTLNEMTDADELRRASRLAYLIAEEDLEAARNSYEGDKLQQILKAFPDSTATARYILTQLISAESCLACGQDATDLSSQIERRVADGLCPICGQPTPKSTRRRRVGANDATQALAAAVQRVEAARERLELDEDKYRQLIEGSRAARQQLSDAESQLTDLRRQLPLPSADTARKLEELSVFEQQLQRLDADLLERRERFAEFLNRTTSEILSRAAEIEARFTRYAQSFLLEENKLSWESRSARVGQTGASLPFPHFSLEMSGTDFPGATARPDADSVSESQREFIDLAFRMSLVDLASANGATLVIDSPDSSLDAVFEEKAAEALSAYSVASVDRTLIVTSNISSGDFLPDLVKRFRAATHEQPQVIDLFDVGVPTAAVRELESDYRRAKRRLFRRAGLN